ncbi:MAG: DUF4810 domain-containing protein [Treponema sp.]|nr:DUF4810 domain-containing protein [Treponema sp.]
MRKSVFWALIAASAVILASCGSTPVMYNWYGYTNTTYEYVKAGDDESNAKLLEVYQKIVDGQADTLRQTVPPGVCADYGYMLVKGGKIDEGKALLLKEKELYPESAAFIDSILRRIER